MNPIDQDKGTPISVVIRNRLKDARKRFHANDNISAYIEPGELGQLLDEVEQKMKGVLESLVIDTVSDHKCLAGALPLSLKLQSFQTWNI